MENANNLRRNKDRRNFQQFAVLIATPGNLVTGFALPANGKLFASSDASLTGVVPYVSIRGVDHSGDNGAVAVAQKVHALGYAQEQAVVMKSTTAQGTVKLYVQDGMGRLFVIGQG